MIGRLLRLSLFVVVAAGAASCGGTGTTPAAPTAIAPTQTPGSPASTATAPPTAEATQAPTAAPTEAPAVEPTPTTPRETVSFTWAPGAVKPSDADDVAVIITELKNHEGLLGGTGDESGIDIFYDPTVITIEEIEALMRQIGHPVMRDE